MVQITNVVQGPTVVVANQQSSPGFLARAVWFVFIGSWLSLVWIIAAWALIFSILGIPLGVAMLNRIPKILTLKPTRRVLSVTTNGNVVMVTQGSVPQLPFLARAVYFCLVGFWLSFFWLLAAWALSLTVILLPVALLMFDKSPAIVSLRRQ